MKILMTAAAAAFALAIGALNASAGTDLDRAVGAGSFIHPTGPAHGVWGTKESAHQDKH